MRSKLQKEGTVGWIVLFVLLILIILPLGAVLLQVVDPGLIGEKNEEGSMNLLLEVFRKPLWSKALTNSLLLGICTTLLGTCFGAFLAAIRVKWDFRTGRLLDIAAWILMIMPSFIIAQGWVYFASGNGVARAWLGWDGISSLVFSFPGLVFIMVLNKFPFAYVTIKSALEWKPKRLSYAARVNGATAWEEWKTVQAPLCIPAYCSAAILIFMDTIGDFGLPSAISGVYRFQTLPYAIYQALYSSPIRFDMAGVLSFYLVLIIIAAMVLQYLIMGRKRFDFMDTGTVQAVPERPPRAAGILLNITGTFLAFLTLCVPIGSTVIMSFSLAATSSSTAFTFLSVTFWISPSASFCSSSESPSFFWAFLSRSIPSLRALRTTILAFSPEAFAFLMSSLRLSSVSAGTVQRITSPLFWGVNPRFASIIAFSILGIMFFSQGWMARVLASGVVIEATCDTGVGVP